MISADKAPWVTSTPNARLASIKPEQKPEGQDLPLPPQPVLQAPPAPPWERKEDKRLSEEEMTKLTHYKGLVNMKVALPPELDQEYQELLQREQDLRATKKLGRKRSRL